ncbi:hypothetical protein EVAR_99556_1 [Eumeta japonica]|uniref:Uncharacterized protein n=1 Tax=Eumeta variegata TaxID=151549 RepID=A0A4C1YWJ3_EUMVA|nr:hypothetical protein EVAR_99556_1 [Eumeta japonica]
MDLHERGINKIKIEEDRAFLKTQKEPGRSGCLGGVDKKLADKEETARQRRLEEEERIVRNRDLMAIAYTSTTNILQCTEDSDEEQILNSELSLRKVPSSEKASERVVEALGLNNDDFSINKSSIQRIRTQGDVTSWHVNTAFLEAKRRGSILKVVNDTAERAVELIQDFNGLITAEEEQNSPCCGGSGRRGKRIGSVTINGGNGWEETVLLVYSHVINSFDLDGEIIG